MVTEVKEGMAHWNKGSGFLTNSHTDIETILANHQPHIIGLSEANLKSTHDLSTVQHSDYQLHTCPTLGNPALRISRVVAYTHKSLIDKRRDDLDDDKISAIWLEVGLPSHRKFLVCQTYREWQHGNNQGDRASNSIPEQLNRWLTFLDQWERALLTGMEVHCLGDMNLNHCNWTDYNIPRSNQSYKLRELISALFTKIFPHGVTQLVTGPTRHFPGQVSTGLDHYYTNRPDKMSAVQTHHCGGQTTCWSLVWETPNPFNPDQNTLEKGVTRTLILRLLSVKCSKSAGWTCICLLMWIRL